MKLANEVKIKSYREIVSADTCPLDSYFARKSRERKKKKRGDLSKGEFVVESLGDARRYLLL